MVVALKNNTLFCTCTGPSTTLCTCPRPLTILGFWSTAHLLWLHTNASLRCQGTRDIASAGPWGKDRMLRIAYKEARRLKQLVPKDETYDYLRYGGPFTKAKKGRFTSSTSEMSGAQSIPPPFTAR